jgi:hypothetical protein
VKDVPCYWIVMILPGHYIVPPEPLLKSKPPSSRFQAAAFGRPSRIVRIFLPITFNS